MRTLYVFDQKDYHRIWRRYRRFAVRAIIPADGGIFMVRSRDKGFYKFPGGGIEKNESHLETLIRETGEETGLNIIPESVRPYGLVREIRRDVYHKRQIFDHSSYYYFAKTTAEVTAVHLDDYEAELGFELKKVELREAYEVNSRMASEGKYAFLIREARVLELLLRDDTAR